MEGMTGIFAAGGSLAFIGMFYNQIAGHIKKFYNVFIADVKLTGIEALIIFMYFRHEYNQTKFRKRSIFSIIFVNVIDGKFMYRLNKQELPNGETVIFSKGIRGIVAKNYLFQSRENCRMEISYVRFFLDFEKVRKKAHELFEEKYLNGRGKYVDEHINSSRFFVSEIRGSLGKTPSLIGDSRNNETSNSQIEGSADTHEATKYEMYLDFRQYYDGGEFYEFDANNFTEEEEYVDPFDNMYLQPEIKDVIKESEIWLKNKKFFEERGFPWKLGYLLYGKQGTGKTMFVKTVGRRLDLPVISFALGSFTDEEFSGAWKDRLDGMKPCIVVFEDFDNVFHGRENIVSEKKDNIMGVTFDTLLNCIDGVRDSSGIMLFITTNEIDKIDPALGVKEESGISSRPGRINQVIEMRNPDEEGYREIAKKTLKGLNEEIVSQACYEAETKDMTVDQFNYHCRCIVEKYYFSEFLIKERESELV